MVDMTPFYLNIEFDKEKVDEFEEAVHEFRELCQKMEESQRRVYRALNGMRDSLRATRATEPPDDSP